MVDNKYLAEEVLGYLDFAIEDVQEIIDSNKLNDDDLNNFINISNKIYYCIEILEKYTEMD